MNQKKLKPGLVASCDLWPEGKLNGYQSKLEEASTHKSAKTHASNVFCDS